MDDWPDGDQQELRLWQQGEQQQLKNNVQNKQRESAQYYGHGGASRQAALLGRHIPASFPARGI